MILTIFPHSGEMAFGNWWCSHRFGQPHATQQSHTVSKHFPFWHSVHADTTNAWDGVNSNSRSSCITVHKARKSGMKATADLGKYKGSISVSKIGPLILGPPRTQRKRQEVTPSFTKVWVPVTMAKSCHLLHIQGWLLPVSSPSWVRFLCRILYEHGQLQWRLCSKLSSMSFSNTKWHSLRYC